MADRLSISRGRVLEPELIKKLMDEEETKGTLKQRWPKHDDKPALLEAIKNKESFVTIGTKRFKLRYTNMGHVFVSPATKEFVPCGWFSIRELESDLLEAKA